MRSRSSASYPLIGATAAALMVLQSPGPVSANTESKAEPAAEAAPAPAAPQTADKPAEAQAEAPAKPKPLPPTLVARIHLNSQTMVVQAGDKTIHTWKVSTGAPGYATPPGSFKPGWMAKMWHSRQYDNAPMPHSVFFNGGIAVHGTTSLGNLGRAASHGCVRLAPANAARFYSLVSKHGMAQTRIVVHGTQPFKSNTMIAGGGRSRHARSAGGWTIVPSQSAQLRRGTRVAGYRADRYGYAPVPQPRRTANARVHTPYWARY